MREYNLYPLEDQSRLPEVCALFAKGLSDTTPSYWQWKHYTENGHPQGMILVAEAEDGSLAGMFALQPVWYQCGNDKKLMIQAQDLVIAPEHRGTGLMKKLYEYALNYYKERGAWGYMAFTNEASYPVFMKYGAVDMGDIYTYNTKKSPIPYYSNKKCKVVGNWSFEVTGQMPKGIMFEDANQSYKMEKTSVFMKWKFEDNPDEEFQWLAIRENENLEGYLVFCITKGRFRRAVNIYDWELTGCVTSDVLREAVKLLQTYGNWVSLWGRYDEETLKRWGAAGLEDKNEKGSHFLLTSFGEDETPKSWQLTRADLDY